MAASDIRAFRQSLGLSAGAFARAIGVSDGARIREWESGRKEPHAAVITLVELAKDIPEIGKALVTRAAKG